MVRAQADMLFEVSYEVCNKIGGIYTVIVSKAQLMNEKYKDYIAIGPYYQDKANVGLQQIPPPIELAHIFDELRNEGIECIYGKWLIAGEPNTILIDFRKKMHESDDIKKQLWESFGVDSLNCSWDFNEPMVWAWCAGRFLEKVKEKFPDKKIVSHFHEWLAGIALLYLKTRNISVKTVFTTHATMLGRAIAGAGDDLYGMLENMNPYDEAKRRGVTDKFTTEKACAKECNVFTTVSEITAIEAEKILEKKADILVLNGLDVQAFPTIEGTSVKHQKARDTIREFLTYYFFPYYKIDLEESLNFFILSRNEFKNKGIDIYIKVLGELNRKMKKEKSKKTIFSFISVPMEAHGIRTEILESENYYEDIKKNVEDQQEYLQMRLIRDFASGDNPKIDNLYPKDFTLNLKRTIQRFQKKGESPPICTHYLSDEDNNEILKALRSQGLLNAADDNIKVIVYPVYVSESDRLLGLQYYDVIAGSHLGVFPSYYEPWGYTPLEYASLAVPSVTTDLAGFGRYVNTIRDGKEGGIYVLRRYQRNEEEVLADFTSILHNFSKLKKQDRVKQKVVAKELSNYADWSVLINNYINAHNLALERK